MAEANTGTPGGLTPLTPRLFMTGLVKTSATVGLAVVVGDALSQMSVKGWDLDNVDRERNMRMLITSTFVSGPTSYAWNQFLERALPGRSFRIVFMKMACNGLFAPFQIALTFSAVGFLAGKSASDNIAKIKQDLPTTFAVGGLYWPLIGFMQFRYVPLSYRPLVGAGAGVLYQTFFSNMANRAVVVPAAVASQADEAVVPISV